MRLHRVRLRNYRGVADCEVEFATEGVTIVEGPNEVGKTCIPEGLDLVLDLLDSSHHRRVRSVKPVGRDVGPDVEVEMTSGRYRFVYRKRWLRQSETTLEVSAPQREQLSGRAAHERVNEILDETLDRQLWNALRVEQGTELALPGFDVPSLGNALDRAAGGNFERDQDDDLWAQISEERDRYWTSTGRTRKDRTRQHADVEEAQAQVADLEQRLVGMDSDADKANRLASEARRLASTRDDCEQQVLDLSDEWAAAEQLCNRVERLAADSNAARAKRDRVVSDQQRRQELIEALQARTAELDGLKTQADQAAPALAAAIHHATEAESDVETARGALRSAEDGQRRANEDRDHHRRHIEVSQLRERHERVIAAETALRAAEAHLEAARVDDDLLAQIEKAHLDKVAADAAVASIETTALRAVSLRIDGDDITLAADETRCTVVEDELEVTVSDLARIRVTAGTGNKSLAVERSNARDGLARLCEAGGVADLAGARRAAEQRREAERDRDNARETIKRDLRDLTVEDLSSKIKGLSHRISEYASNRPSDPPMPSDFEEAKRIAANTDRALAHRRANLEDCENTVRSASQQREEAQRNNARLSGQIDIACSAREEAALSLEGARQQRSDGDIEGQLDAARREAGAALASLEQAQEELRLTDPDSLELKLRNARDAANRAVSDMQANRDRQNELRISLSVRGEEGLHTRRDEAVRRLRRLKHERDGMEARAQAARMLHDTFSRCRQEAHHRYVGPFQERIDQLGRIVFNPSFSVNIDPDLHVVGRTLNADILEVDQLSTGALEQLGVLSRLACAAIVSPDGGGAPLLIDDALGWSDPDRLDGMGAAIAAAGRQCQVIILTCTPGRYSRVGNATTIRLPSSI